VATTGTLVKLGNEVQSDAQASEMTVERKFAILFAG